MTPREHPTQTRVKELLDYNPLTGVFSWKVCPNNTLVKIGAPCTCVNSKGYILVGVDGRRYVAHRLAWLYVHGKWPNGWLDHINGDRQDNRIDNLRLATPSQNSANARGKPGRLKGASFSKSKRKWVAQIRVNFRSVHLGYFQTEEEAHGAYCKAAKQHHGDYARFK